MFTKIHSDLFDDEKVAKLSALNKSALFYLMGNKNVRSSGFYQVGYYHACEFLMVTERELTNCLFDLESAGFIFFDDKIRVVFIKDFLLINKAVSDQQIKGVVFGIDNKCLQSKHFPAYIHHLCLNKSTIAIAHRICEHNACFNRIDQNTMAMIEKYKKINSEPYLPGVTQ